jgi:phosphatidylserine decarboxylase
MKLHVDRYGAQFLWTKYSKPLIDWYIKSNGISVTKAEIESFRSFRDMFVRTREPVPVDHTPGHLISPCDGWLSVYRIDEHSCFSIKNSYYQIKDFLQDETLAKNYNQGICMVFRLCPSDYHHYSYIDDGYQGEHHHIPGVLHSVQPIACEKYPVYVLNKRCWSLLTTEHFGPVVQCEIGALVIGGIFNEKENTRFCKGSEKGHFELAGSTIVLLFEPGQINLKPEILEQIAQEKEYRVEQGQWIATAALPAACPVF